MLHTSSPTITQNGLHDIETYRTWVKEHQSKRASATLSHRTDLEEYAGANGRIAPRFDSTTLFLDGAQEYASALTSVASEGCATVIEETRKAGLFAPCMVGRLEGQFLKMVAKMIRARRVLEIGTFTGYSAISFAEGVTSDGQVLTVEMDQQCAAVARKCFRSTPAGSKVQVIEGEACAVMAELAEAKEKFDIVFLDADKKNYSLHYEAALTMLNEGGLVMADNALGGLVFDKDDPARQSLHEFAQKVRADTRVEQVFVTVREGILIARKV